MAEHGHFLAHGVDMGAALRARDWSLSPLGDPKAWPAPLHATVMLMLDTTGPSWLAWGPELSLLYNDAYRPLLGNKHPDAFGQPLARVWAEIWPDVGPLVDRTLKGEPVMLHDVRLRVLRSSDPEDAYFTFSYAPLRDEDGSIRGLFCSVLETTAGVLATQRRDASELALRKERDLARENEASAIINAERVQLALAAGAILGTWVWDLPTNRFTVDEAFAVNFGLDPELGRSGLSLGQVVETVHPDDQVGLAAAINEVIARGGRYAHQYRVRRHDGRYYWLEANGHVEHAPDGTPLRFPGVLLDIEQRHALSEERDRALNELQALNETPEQRVAERTEELKRSEEALHQAQKMEAVGQLTGGIAHDFNNLLTAISGSLELMNTRIVQGRFEELQRFTAAAQAAAKRAATLTHRLLAFSRQQTLSPRIISVNDLVRGILDLIQRSVGPSIEVEFTGCSALWLARADSSQLENALLNLCINARDAMPGGGRITIETDNCLLDQAAAERLDMDAGQYISLGVADTGTGMAPEVIAKAFDPFFTTKPIGQGTGLGLSMIYGFAKQSGGQVRIHSEVGKGTTVCIYLPRYQGTAEQSDPVPETPAATFAQSGKTVLIVDDEPTIRLLITGMLEDQGFSVIEANDSAGGLRVLQSDVRIDLLITDLGLPGSMNGRQMVDIARAKRSDLRVLFITGFAEDAFFHGGQLEAGMSVLTKPFSIDILVARVRELIAHGRPVRSGTPDAQ